MCSLNPRSRVLPAGSGKEATTTTMMPWLLVGTGAVWLAFVVVQSSFFAPLALLAFGLCVWLQRFATWVRQRGGPLALAPQWLQSLLLETRPLDAMSAVAVLIDAQKGFGLLVHLLAALRLDDAERDTFVEQLPKRIRDFVLAPGLLGVVPRSVQALVLWEQAPRERPTERHAADSAATALPVREEPGDAPRADPFEDHDDLGALTDALIARDDGRTQQRGLAASTATSSFSKARDEDEDETTSSSSSDEDEVTSWRERRASLLSHARVLAATMRKALVDAFFIGRSTEQKKKKKPRRRKKVHREKSVARAVAEFNPWPTLLRVVSRRVATWLQTQLTVSTLTTIALAATTSLTAQLALSPASRRIAANSARLGAVVAATGALSTSVAAFAVLHAGSLQNAIEDSKTNSFSPRNNPTRFHHDHPHPTTRDPKEHDVKEDLAAADVVAEEDSSDDDGVSPRSPRSPPWTSAAVIVCGYAVARSCDFQGFYDFYSPFAAQLSARLARAILRLRAPFE